MFVSEGVVLRQVYQALEAVVASRIPIGEGVLSVKLEIGVVL